LLAGGSRQILSYRFPGDIFDSQSYLLDEMDHSIAAAGQVTLVTISHSHISNLLNAHREVARALWKETLVDAAVFREWIVNTGHRPAVARLAHLFSEVYCRLYAIGLSDGTSIEWPVTQRDPADATGLTSIHVNRTPKQMREDALITLGKGRLVIRD
jgi:CRP-like cAMP-binding protein